MQSYIYIIWLFKFIKSNYISKLFVYFNYILYFIDYMKYNYKIKVLKFTELEYNMLVYIIMCPLFENFKMIKQLLISILLILEDLMAFI